MSNYDKMLAASQALFLGCQEEFVGYSGCAELAKIAQTTLHVAKNEEDLFEAAIRWL